MKRKRGQRGPSKATLDLIATCSKIIETCQPISVRGVAYKLFTAGIIDSMAKKNTQKISRILVQAREEGTIPWDWIVDQTRKVERQPSWEDLEEYSMVVASSYRRDFWATQDNVPIVISEKATVDGVLRPVLDEHGVPFFAAKGFNSATKIHDLAQQIADEYGSRKYVFLYVGDWDPSGMHMSEVDFPGRLKRYGAKDFEFRRIAIVWHDREGLPSFPGKKADPRFKWFSERYGKTAWELDAMDPNQLRDRVRGAINEYVDRDAWERHRLIEQAQMNTTRKIAKQLAELDQV